MHESSHIVEEKFQTTVNNGDDDGDGEVDENEEEEDGDEDKEFVEEFDKGIC